MARRPGYPLYGAQFCGNTSKKEVHDLDKEQVNCQINEIIRAGHVYCFPANGTNKGFELETVFGEDE